MPSRAAHWLTLVLAVLGGVLPLRVCSPADGAGCGVRLIGQHAHDEGQGHDADDSASHGCSCGHHDCTGGGREEPTPHHECCADVPLESVVTWVATPLDLPAPVAFVADAPREGLHARDGFEPSVSRLDPTETTVLLR